MSLLASVTTLAAAAPPVPDAVDSIITSAGTSVTQFFDVFGGVLPYAAAMTALAWGYSTAKGMIGGKKKKPV